LLLLRVLFADDLIVIELILYLIKQEEF